jgi:hypothetical protein
MGYSYSKQQSSTDTQKSTQDQNTENVYILFMNNTVKTYHNDFDVCYKEARRLCKNITFELMMNYGSSNYVSFEEEIRDDGSCNIVIYSTPRNMFGNMSRQIDTVILIKKIEKLKPIEEDYTTRTNVENITNNISQDNEENNDDSENDSEEDEESDIENYNEHNESDEEDKDEEKTE